MAKPLDDDERARIVALIESGQTAKTIADETGRSTGTISNIAKSIGWRFGQSNLARAHEARSAYCAERRAGIASTATEHIERVLAEYFDKQQVIALTPDGTVVVDVKPDARALRDMASAVHTLTRTVIEIDRHDNRNDDGLAAVDEWLRGIVGSAA